jgi:hypothetical protein
MRGLLFLLSIQLTALFHISRGGKAEGENKLCAQRIFDGTTSPFLLIFIGREEEGRGLNSKGYCDGFVWGSLRVGKD